MKKIIFLLIIISSLLVTSAYAQQPKRIDINSQTVFKDQYGSNISFDTFLKMTSAEGYEMKPIFDDNSELVEIFVLKPSVAPSFVPPSARRPAPNRYRSAPMRTSHMAAPTAPKFEAYDLNQNYYNLSDMSGKVVVLKFWFTGCRPCIEEIPQLNDLVAKYKNNPDVVFLAAATDKPDRLQSFLQRVPFDYNIIAEARDLGNKYMVIGYPTHIVINTDGRIEAVYKGVNRKINEKISGAIERALNADVAKAAFISNQPSQATSSYISAPRRITNTFVKTPIDTDVPEKEVFITPQSIIKNEAGDLIPFSSFVEMMNEDHYELINRRDMDNSTYVLIRPAKK